MNVNIRKRINPELGYKNMVSTLMASDVHIPFVPETLRPRVVVREKWCWSTAPVNSFDMYLMDEQYFHELITADAGDGYMALSHAGHGLNSYGLQYALRYGPLVVFLQSSFGGVYNDHKGDVRRINTTFEQVSGLLEKMPADMMNKAHTKRIVLLWSSFRGACNYSVSDLSSDIHWQTAADKKQLFKDAAKELVKLVRSYQ